MKTVKKTREIMETYYVVKCSRCGNEFETMWSCHKHCDKCREELELIITENTKKIFLNAKIIGVDVNVNTLMRIVILSQDGKKYYIEGEYDVDENSLDYGEFIEGIMQEI